MHMNKAMIVYEFAAQTLMYFFLFFLLHNTPTLSCTALFHIGTWNNKQLIIMTEVVADFTQEYSIALTAPHAFTHCGSTSAFKSIRKVKYI